MRLIDADLMIDELKQEIVELELNGMKGTPAYTSDLRSMIDRLEDEDQAPTVDAVPVVLCRECVMWKKYEKTAVYGYCRNKRFFAFEYGFETEENFTCADGERKGADENEKSV